MFFLYNFLIDSRIQTSSKQWKVAEFFPKQADYVGFNMTSDQMKSYALIQKNSW